MLLIAVAGGLGALARFGLQKLLPAHGYHIPLGVLIANVAGSLVAGFTGGLAITSTETGSAIALIVITGFCGGLTTFSTFAVETIQLNQAGTGKAASINVAANVTLGLIAAFVGLWVATVLA
jgi:CrcB protein